MHVDYAGLPPVQRAMLEDLRARVDADGPDDPRPDRKDGAALALARIVGVGELDERLAELKADEERPWAEVPEGVKVRVLVELAAEAGAPGRYALEVIEREVDADRLLPWRWAALEDLRGRFDRGTLDGENANPRDPGDRAGLALRLAELAARVEDARHSGIADADPGRPCPWDDLDEGVKLGLILHEIRELGLESESAAYSVVDPRWTWRTCPTTTGVPSRRPGGRRGPPSAARWRPTCRAKASHGSQRRPPRLPGRKTSGTASRRGRATRRPPPPARSPTTPRPPRP